jgi:hypothetical protein
MRRRYKEMPHNQDVDDIENGKLPPSDITKLAQNGDIDLDAMSTEELLTFIEDALDRLPVEELITIRDAAAQKRLERLETEKNAVIAEMREKLAKIKNI